MMNVELIGMKLKKAWYSTCKEKDGVLIPITRDDGSLYVEDSVFNKLHDEVRKSTDSGKECIALDVCDFFLGMGTIEVITFKREGNCFVNGGINYKVDDKIVNSLTNSVSCIGGYVIDLYTGINGMPISKYLESLYDMNNKCNIRIDYTLSAFNAYEDGDALTTEMCSYLKTREGLSYKKFIELNAKAKKDFEERQKQGD